MEWGAPLFGLEILSACIQYAPENTVKACAEIDWDIVYFDT